MRLLLTCVFLLVLNSCAAKEEIHLAGIESLAWLEGKWISEDENGTFIEEWQKAGASLSGQGTMITGSDTSQMEKLRIVQDGEKLSYVVNFPNREVEFVLRSQSTSESYKNFNYDYGFSATFINDTNDFPSQITYRRQENDSLYITLTGREAAKQMSMTFRMKRLK